VQKRLGVRHDTVETFLRQHELDQVQRVVMLRKFLVTVALYDLSVPWRDSPSAIEGSPGDSSSQGRGAFPGGVLSFVDKYWL